MYFDFLPPSVAKKFDERYKERPHFYKRDLVDADMRFYNNFELNKKANSYLVRKFPYIEFMRKNIKYKKDNRFTYLKKWGDYIMLFEWRMYYTWDSDIIAGAQIQRILFFNTINQEQYAYALGLFKNIYIMMPAEEVRYMSTYTTGYNMFYSHEQRLQHPKTIKLIKSMPQFKYLPINKFDKVNYFHLLNATKEKIYQYELLLKIGATKLASGLLIENKLMNKEELKKIKSRLNRNRSYQFYMDLIYREKLKEEERKKRLKLANIDSKLKNKQRLKYEIGKYILFSPKSIKEMEHESNILQHCLGKSMLKHYAQQIIDNKSTILFLRDKTHVDDPYFTIEIKNGELAQCRTKNNKTDENITNIVKKFVDEHKDEFIYVQI